MSDRAPPDPRREAVPPRAPSKTVIRAWVAAVVVAGCLPVPASAQSSGTIVGTVVVGASEVPAHGALVSIVGGRDGATTGADGSFRISGLREGDVTVQATADGHTAALDRVRVVAGRETSLQLRIDPVEAALDALLVTVDRPQPGSMVHPEGTGRSGVRTAAELIAGRAAGIRVAPTSGNVGGGSSVTIRGPSSIRGGAGPRIVVDGVLLPDRATAEHVLEALPADHVEAIEIHRGPSAAAWLGDAVHGVIVVRTRSGRRPGG